MHASRFKLFVSKKLEHCELKSEKEEELKLLKKAIKNVASIITTNYDMFVENHLGFFPVVGNDDILLSNEYGTVYKIHGSVTMPDKLL